METIGEASGRFVSICKQIELSKNRASVSVIESWQGNIRGKLRERLIDESKKWDIRYNPIFTRDKLVMEAIQKFNSNLKDDIKKIWIEENLKPILFGELEFLDRKIKQEFQDLNLSFGLLDEKIHADFCDELLPELTDFDVAFIAAFAGGGAVGGGGAAAAAFFLIPAFTLGPAIIAGIVAALLLAIASGTWATFSAYTLIYKKVCEECFTEFEKEESQQLIKQKIKEAIGNLFMERAETVGNLIKQIISESENWLAIEEKKQVEGDRLRSLISSKKQEFEKSLSI